MFALLGRAFLWLSGGYALNDIGSAFGTIFFNKEKEDKKVNWLGVGLLITILIILFKWLRKRKYI